MRNPTRKPLAELKLLAQPEMISTAKRTASSLGSLVGFSLEDIDELTIAVAQACDSAIEAGIEAWGDEATLKLTFWSTDRGMEVEVQAVQPRASALGEKPRPQPRQHVHDEAFDRLTLEMIRCFVDDFRPALGPNRVRFRLVKHLLG
jgi:anti-sigma regulatory factor (Ser/Thr protein kinase)